MGEELILLCIGRSVEEEYMAGYSEILRSWWSGDWVRQLTLGEVRRGFPEEFCTDCYLRTVQSLLRNGMSLKCDERNVFIVAWS